MTPRQIPYDLDRELYTENNEFWTLLPLWAFVKHIQTRFCFYFAKCVIKMLQ